MRAQSCPGCATLLRFCLLSLLPLLAIVAQNALQAQILGPSTWVFLGVVWLEYSVLYLLGAIALPLLCAALAHSGRLRRKLPAVAAVLHSSTAVVAVVTTTLMAFLLFVDATIFRMYGFHWNGFVWNLLTTRGGIESMDGGTGTWVTGAVILVVLLLVQLGLMRLAKRELALWAALRPTRPRRLALLLLTSFLVLGCGERVAFAIANLKSYRPITVSQDVFPFYKRLRVKRVAELLGMNVSQDVGLRDARGSLELRYPLAPLRVDPAARPLNVVWLVAESWRGDTVTPEIMPDTVAFAQRSLWFKNHYSGGNSTTMGVFSMFYGLYASYWFPFLAAERSPVLIDLLQAQGYQLFVSTSAKFTFPEFDKTIWRNLPASELIEGDPELMGWQNDRQLVDRLLQRIDERDTRHPFFAFHFFESPHSRYHFPDECIIRRPYCEVVNYALLTRADMPEVENRYFNSVRHLDTQIARVIHHLEETGLLDSTIVVLAGDHGEEFMEKGRYGHHSAFSEEQTRAALILWLPGELPRAIEELSSHSDLPATILPRLGVTNDAADYTVGHDLAGPQRRDFVVIADWDRLCIRDGAGKGIFPLTERESFNWKVTTIDDAPSPDPDAWVSRASTILGEVARDQRRFTK